ncbi:MAG: carbon starvation protein A [Planctomycetota bacterium]
MYTFLLAIVTFVGFIVAYHTYGRWLARSIFNLNPEAEVPSKQLQDDVDFVPSAKSIVFGHHFTSIAGTGPIVGPAIAVFWGWLPALLWVVFGSIFIGAVHDFGALVVSMRNRGQTVGEVAGRLISPRAKILFLLVLFFALTIVLAIFGLVIASIFAVYPESVLPVWISLPIAVILGLVVKNRPQLLLPLSMVALLLVYAAVYTGAYHLPIELKLPQLESEFWQPFLTPLVIWTIILLLYCAVASVLPVWILLQPRDFINSHQLFVALALLVAGLGVASISGQADLFASAPAMVETESLPLGTPPIWPFLFITIACGAISGFHCLVSSGTSSKQISCESDAQYIGYGAMLTEGALATIVILACCAGTGMGKIEKSPASESSQTAYRLKVDADGTAVVGRAAWETYYTAKKWSDFSLKKKLAAFVEGGANFLCALGLPLKISLGIISVLVACFAATTLDTATRLQRYVIQEIGNSVSLSPLKNMYVATAVAVILGGLIAMLPGPKGPGTGGLLLWPLFGATNQLLAGLAFMVTVFYLWRRNKPVWFVALPMLLMIALPAWALLWQLFSTNTINGKPIGWWWDFQNHWLLGSIALITLGLQLWMVIEAVLIWPAAKGVIEEALPPIQKQNRSLESSGGRSC